MTQLDYPVDFNRAFPGMIQDGGPKDVRAYAAEGATEFGVCVVDGTDPERQAAKPVAGAQKAKGVSIYTPNVEAEIDGTRLYKDEREMNVLRDGRIAVRVDDGVTVTKGDPVFVRITAPGAEILGAFRTDADGGDAVATTGCRWYRGGDDADPPILEVDKTFTLS